MATVAEHLNHNRKELLDLSARNRLLNIPKTSKTARLIHIVDELTAEVFRILKTDGRAMSFLPGRRGEGEVIDAESDLLGYTAPALPEDEQESGIAKRHIDTKLQTALTPDGLQRRLLSLHTDARTIKEEQGINVLFLAMGVLHWFENDSTKTERFAPLVLLPVELERSSASERFKIKWDGQEIQENLSLAEKLRKDFGIELPTFGSEDDFDTAAYFSSVQKCISDRAGWTVEPNDITLGFFSFAKLMMFLDLDPTKWTAGSKIDESALVSGLLVDGFVNDPLPFDDNGHLDDVIPVDRLDHVVDADGSQSAVIDITRRGRNLVVQGPPGTGKSQTICNILAAAVLEGKRVLFVAEKMAALDVVKRRLEANGLGALCLELHSNKANKKAVLDDLANTWRLGKPVSGDHNALFRRLDELRKTLNLHCAVMHTPQGTSGLTPFQIIGELAKLRDSEKEFPALEFPQACKWTAEYVADIKRCLGELTQRVDMIGAPGVNVWRGSQRTHFLRIDAEPLRKIIRDLEEAITEFIQARDALCNFLNHIAPRDIAGCEHLYLIAEHIGNAPRLDKRAIVSSVWSAGIGSLHELISAGRQLSAIYQENAALVLPTAWSKDLTGAREKIAKHGESLLRIFVKDYREGFKEFRAQLDSKPPSAYKDRLLLLDRIIEGQKLLRQVEGAFDLGTAAFGEQWKSDKSDWDHLTAITRWVEGSTAAGLSEQFRELFASVEKNESAISLAENTTRRAASLESTFKKVEDALILDVRTNFNVAGLRVLDLSDLEKRVEEWLQSFESLSEWVAYNSHAGRLRSLGVGSLVDELEAGGVTSALLQPAFQWAYCSHLFREVVRVTPELAAFDGMLHESKIEEFKKVDRQRLEFAKLRTLLRHYEQMPPEGDGVGVTGIIKGEMVKKRRHLPLRKLLSQAGVAIQAIKPVFMMSPLSVAQYLEPGVLNFDLLVIDEASQVEPVEALGAIARCKQVVVVGDSKQLPPSRFFMKITSDAADEEEELEQTGAAAKDVESILGLCLAKGIPQKMLRWHYRSRHHTLIAVSNREFYNSDLFIVPSPHDVSESLGLKFNFHSDGVFDSGNTGINRVEAQAVARAVISHAEKNPQMTLGVAAFSTRQRDAIIDELELTRRSRPDLEAFFCAHPHEPFFVKNLENVQGDERDVIYISIGYARDPSGFLAMRFGPLSVEGGERRLNVLISRAKIRCEVFSSIRSEDIDLDRASGRGVAALKSFLRFAETGVMGALRSSGKETDSPFEDAVLSELEKHGLAIDCQVGEAGFFIDLAVKNPAAGGGYLLGIECDGATYHSSRSARDRDRLRQAVLEDHGWAIHRIWSTDWFQRPDRELRRVLLALEKAKQRQESRVPATNKTVEATSVRREDPSPEQLLGTGEAGFEGKLYQIASLSLPTVLPELHEMVPGQLVRHVQSILEVEAPINIDEIVLRLRSAWGYERAGNRIHELVGKSVRLAVTKSSYALEEGFYVNKQKPVLPRRRDESLPPSLRKIENIAPQEVRAAVLSVVERHLGVGCDELAGSVSRLFGFKATSAQIRATIDVQVRKLVKSGVLLEAGDILSRANNAIPGTQQKRV